MQPYCPKTGQITVPHKIKEPMTPLTEGEKRSMLKSIRDYFGEHDRTQFEHSAFTFMTKLIDEPVSPSKGEEKIADEEDRMIRDAIIKGIPINEANLLNIAEHGRINGSLLIDIRNALNKYRDYILASYRTSTPSSSAHGSEGERLKELGYKITEHTTPEGFRMMATKLLSNNGFKSSVIVEAHTNELAYGIIKSLEALILFHQSKREPIITPKP